MIAGRAQRERLRRGRDAEPGRPRPPGPPGRTRTMPCPYASALTTDHHRRPASTCARERGDVRPERGQVDLGAAAPACRASLRRRCRRRSPRHGGAHGSAPCRQAPRRSAPASLDVRRRGTRVGGRRRAPAATPRAAPPRARASPAASTAAHRPRPGRRPSPPAPVQAGPATATLDRGRARVGHELGRALEQHGRTGPLATPARTAASGSSVDLARSSPSSLASSPACGVSTQASGSRSGQVPGRPRRPPPARPRRPRRPTTWSPSGRSPQPEPKRWACTRPSAKTTFGRFAVIVARADPRPRKRTIPAPPCTAPYVAHDPGARVGLRAGVHPDHALGSTCRWLRVRAGPGAATSAGVARRRSRGLGRRVEPDVDQLDAAARLRAGSIRWQAWRRRTSPSRRR